MNVTLFNASMGLYLAAAVLYAVHLAARRNRAVGIAATATLVVGLLVNTAAFAVRYLESSRLGFAYMPLSNMYESKVFFAWCIVLVYLIFEWRYRLRALGAFVAPLAALCIAIVSLNPKISSELQPLVPALQSNWLTAHVVTCFIGYGAFALAFAVSVVYLFRGQGTAVRSPRASFSMRCRTGPSPWASRSLPPSPRHSGSGRAGAGSCAPRPPATAGSTY